MKCFLWQRKQWFIALSMLFLLALSLAACGNNGSGNGSSKPTSTAGAGGSPTSIPSSPPTVQMGTQPCPEAVKDPAYWNPFISAPPPAIRDAYIVRCGYLLGKPTLQAMVVAT